MYPRLIKTERDYRAALRRIDELMDARTGTRLGDELELLATLVELYEEEHSPIPPPNPIDAIRFRMEQENLQPRDLIAYLGHPQPGLRGAQWSETFDLEDDSSAARRAWNSGGHSPGRGKCGVGLDASLVVCELRPC